MKKHLVILTALMLVAAGCETWRSNRAENHNGSHSTDQSTTVSEASGAQSHSSDPNPASSSRNVGQSRTTQNQPQTGISGSTGQIPIATNPTDTVTTETNKATP